MNKSSVTTRLVQLLRTNKCHCDRSSAVDAFYIRFGSSPRFDARFPLESQSAFPPEDVPCDRGASACHCTLNRCRMILSCLLPALVVNVNAPQQNTGAWSSEPRRQEVLRPTASVRHHSKLSPIYVSPFWVSHSPQFELNLHLSQLSAVLPFVLRVSSLCAGRREGGAVPRSHRCVLRVLLVVRWTMRGRRRTCVLRAVVSPSVSGSEAGTRQHDVW